jgi:hypothetical protein
MGKLINVDGFEMKNAEAKGRCRAEDFKKRTCAYAL